MFVKQSKTEAKEEVIRSPKKDTKKQEKKETLPIVENIVSTSRTTEKVKVIKSEPKVMISTKLWDEPPRLAKKHDSPKKKQQKN